MFGWFENEKPKNEDDKTFIKRIRHEITQNTCQTSGICVFEVNNEVNLDDQERQILETLRKAHEDWVKKNPQPV